MKTSIKIDKLINAIEKRIYRYKALFDTPVKSDLWEEILHQSLGEIGVSTDWKADENHGSGKDMTTEHGIRISCKSGQWKTGKDGKISLLVSGARLTKHKTLKTKIQFISNKEEDIYCLLSRDEKDKTGKYYKFITFSSKMLNYADMDWKELYGVRGRLKGKTKGYIAENQLYKCEIRKGLSDQLWTRIKDIENNPDIIIIDIRMQE